MARWWLADILFTSARLFSFNAPLGNHLSLFRFQAAFLCALFGVLRGV